MTFFISLTSGFSKKNATPCSRRHFAYSFGSLGTSARNHWRSGLSSHFRMGSFLCRTPNFSSTFSHVRVAHHATPNVCSNFHPRTILDNSRVFVRESSPEEFEGFLIFRFEVVRSKSLVRTLRGISSSKSPRSARSLCRPIAPEFGVHAYH